MAKSKKTGFDRVATEEDNGKLSWCIGVLTFHWVPHWSGPLGVSEGEGLPRLISHQRTLANAGLFAEGFAVGCGASSG